MSKKKPAADAKAEKAERSAPDAPVARDSAGGGNGTSSAGHDGDSPNLRRAEEIVDQMAQRMAQYTTAAGRAVLRWTARMREEAEDIWAEAQVVRQGKKP